MFTSHMIECPLLFIMMTKISKHIQTRTGRIVNILITDLLYGRPDWLTEYITIIDSGSWDAPALC